MMRATRAHTLSCGDPHLPVVALGGELQQFVESLRARQQPPEAPERAAARGRAPDALELAVWKEGGSANHSTYILCIVSRAQSGMDAFSALFKTVETGLTRLDLDDGDSRAYRHQKVRVHVPGV